MRIFCCWIWTYDRCLWRSSYGSKIYSWRCEHRRRVWVWWCWTDDDDGFGRSYSQFLVKSGMCVVCPTKKKERKEKRVDLLVRPPFFVLKIFPQDIFETHQKKKYMTCFLTNGKQFYKYYPDKGLTKLSSRSTKPMDDPTRPVNQINPPSQYQYINTQVLKYSRAYLICPLRVRVPAPFNHEVLDTYRILIHMSYMGSLNSEDRRTKSLKKVWKSTKHLSRVFFFSNERFFFLLLFFYSSFFLWGSWTFELFFFGARLAAQLVVRRRSVMSREFGIMV